MNAGRCPICHEPKERRVHLVCPHCWVKVSDADKEELCKLYVKARGSVAHRAKCFSIVRTLHVARKMEAQRPATARTS